MNELRLNEFEVMVQDKNSYVLNIENFNLHVRFFNEDLQLNPNDEYFFSRRTKAWEQIGDGFGTEYFYGNDGKIAGTVTYGLMN